MRRSSFFGLLKVAISLACLYAVWRIFAPANWASMLAGADLGLVLAALLVLTVGQVASGLRHWAILRALNRSLPPLDVVGIAFTGTLFNQVLPSGLGGDVIRAIHFKARCGWPRAIGSVAIDRVAGLGFKLTLALLLTPAYFALPLPLALQILIAIVAAGPAVGLCLALLLLRSRRLRGLVPRPFRPVLLGILYLRRLLAPRNLLVLALPLLGGLLPYIACFGLLGESLGAGLPWTDYLTIVPLVFIAMQFPLSIGGWGVREGAAVALFPMVGMEPGTALLASGLFGAALIVTSLPGLVLWWTRPMATRTAHA